MNILIAPNAFKNSLDAQAAAEAIARGFEQSDLKCTCQLFPVGDGGDGTGDLIIKKFNGELVQAAAHDALGRAITATFGLIDNGRTAVIEMADAAGLRLLSKNELNPLLTTSSGTGEMIKQALDKGARKFIIGMGGSATVDGGMGILSALGLRFLDERGEALSPVPGKLANLATIDVTGLDKRLAGCEIIILCDVDNKLLGDNGAAAVFGPQKGASANDVVILDTLLEKLASITLQQTGIDIAAVKHGGTAGGAAAGLHGFLNAKLVSGAPHFLELTGFEKALQTADLVITGEGSIDEQTLQGKAPAAVAKWAKQKQLPVIGLAGKVQQHAALGQYFDLLLSINKEPVNIDIALKNTRQNLVHTAEELGNRLKTNGLHFDAPGKL
jgi:glycerate kinase